MAEAWEVVNKYILPFFAFLKKILNSVLKLMGQPTKWPE